MSHDDYMKIGMTLTLTVDVTPGSARHVLLPDGGANAIEFANHLRSKIWRVTMALLILSAGGTAVLTVLHGKAQTQLGWTNLAPPRKGRPELWCQMFH